MLNENNQTFSSLSLSSLCWRIDSAWYSIICILSTLSLSHLEHRNEILYTRTLLVAISLHIHLVMKICMLRLASYHANITEFQCTSLMKKSVFSFF